MIIIITSIIIIIITIIVIIISGCFHGWLVGCWPTDPGVRCAKPAIFHFLHYCHRLRLLPSPAPSLSPPPA